MYVNNLYVDVFILCTPSDLTGKMAMIIKVFVFQNYLARQI